MSSCHRPPYHPAGHHNVDGDLHHWNFFGQGVPLNLNDKTCNIKKNKAAKVIMLIYVMGETIQQGFLFNQVDKNLWNPDSLGGNCCISDKMENPAGLWLS